MPSDYEDIAERAEENDVIDPHEITDSQIQSELRNYLNLDDVNNDSRLIDETTERVKEQTVRRDDGRVAGMRKNITIWTDVHGNVMYHHKHTQNRHKLIDKSEVTDTVREEINELKRRDEI